MPSISKGEGVILSPGVEVQEVDSTDQNRLGTFASQCLVSTQETQERGRIDTVEEIVELEKRVAALETILEGYSLPGLDERQKALAPVISPDHAVDSVTNQFAVRLLPPFLEQDDAVALAAFRALQPHTVNEQQALLISDEQFFAMRRAVAVRLLESEEEFVEAAEERLAHLGDISRNDRYQFNSNESRKSLSEILERGVSLEIMQDEETKELFRQALAFANSTGLPLLEFLKNKRVLKANGFEDSKISLAIHDTMDHAWGWNLMRETGLSEKYLHLFDSIGDPEHTDIYSREGEIIASICMGVRLWGGQERGFVPLISADDIQRMMEEFFDRGQLEPRHMEAYRILRGLTQGTQEWQSLGFVFSNYITELDEQRRKHGKIKQRDLGTRREVGELDPFSPEFLSFVTELHHELMRSKNKHRNELFKTHLLLEAFLRGVADGTIPEDETFVIHVQKLKDGYDFEGCELPPRTIKWMRDNYSFTAIKESVI